MRKSLFLISWMALVSCERNISLSSNGESGLKSIYEISTPQIHLSQTGQLINISDLNRGGAVLNLSDQIIFSDTKRGEKLPVLVPLENFKNDENLKIKISSFCSYSVSEIGSNFDEETNRVIQETGSESYYWSFSIFDLLPRKILSNGLDKNFYCSFVFAFKDKQGVFNHYNVAQQIIQPFFSDSSVNKLSLMRETESGHYLPLRFEPINRHQDFSKILLVNNTGQLVDNYQLYCEGLKLLSISGSGSNVIPIFLNLLTYNPDNFPEGDNKCRIFSINKEQITGMTNSFQIHFDGLRNRVSIGDLKDIQNPSMAVMGSSEIYKSGAIIPLNSYFSFNNVNQKLDYSSVEITVSTQCVNDQIFGKGQVLSQTYRFPFRQKFPVMAVTPEKVFAMEMDTKNYDKWLKHKENFLKGKYKEEEITPSIRERQTHASSCVYVIGLQDRANPLANRKSFPEKSYFIPWSNNSYGIDQDPRDNVFLIIQNLQNIKRGEMFLAQLTSYHTEQMEKPFLSVKKDIYNNKIIGHLYFNFFDTIDDRFFEMGGHQLNNMVLKCHDRTDRQTTGHFIEASQPYGIYQKPSISVKALVSNVDIKNGIEKNGLLICRFMLYEGDILRYFSSEMMIVQ